MNLPIGGGNPFTNNLFAQLAFPQFQLLDAANQIPQFALGALHNAYTSASGPASLLQGAFIPPYMSMPSPQSMFPIMGPIAGGGYSGGQQNIDLAGPFTPNNWLARATNPERREAARMERVLRNDPFARQAFEQAVGGRITDFGGKNDGRFTIERFPGMPQIPGMAMNPMAGSINGMLQGMDRSIMSQLGQLALGGVGGAALGGLGGAAFGNPFLGMALGGLGGIAAQLLGGGGLGALGAPGGFASFGSGVQGMPLFGMGQASWNPLSQPGKMQGSNRAYEGAHSAQVHSILSDPSLTMEDKIMLALMVICQKMDEDIKRQTEYINNLQNQQGNRKKGAGMLGLAGTAAGAALGGPAGAKIGGGLGSKIGGGGGQDGEKSIDMETKKLERMITKRSQLFDTLGKIMERYDQSAKNVIQSMRG